MSPPDSHSLLDQFRLALEECRKLYLTSGRRCAECHPQLIKGPPENFVRLMDDLHKGLLLKIYLTVAVADKRLSPRELQFAEILFEHVWGQRLTGGKLREALRHAVDEASKLQWYSLIRPFGQIAPLRTCIGALETVVIRVANLVAKADGEVVLAERARLTEITGHLMGIQDELERELPPVALDEPGQHETAQTVGTQAIQKMSSEIDEVRDQCSLAASEQESKPKKSRRELVKEAQAELDRLVGIENIKQEIRTLVNFLEVQEQRERAGLPRTSLGLHMVLCGNPGTGKTTVARIVGQIFGAMGILEKGHVVETDRSGLVAEYAGQTGTKTNKIVDEALNGILFIDEAYSLVAEKGDDPYGTEAVQTLLKRMEDDRERLVVALAGYPEPIERLLKSNPGLSSRFSRNVRFRDYTAAELGQIFQIMCEKNRYEVPVTVRAKLLLGFQWLLDHRDEHFGNGRMVRNTFETAIRRLANRIVNIVPLTKEILTTFEADDVDMPTVPPEVWDNLEDENRKYKVECPGCKSQSEMPQKYLGRRVECKKCKHRFAAGWGQPVNHP